MKTTKNNARTHSVLITVALVSITIIELYALSKGVNGTALAAAIGAITAIAGYQFGSLRPPK